MRKCSLSKPRQRKGFIKRLASLCIFYSYFFKKLASFQQMQKRAASGQSAGQGPCCHRCHSWAPRSPLSLCCGRFLPDIPTSKDERPPPTSSLHLNQQGNGQGHGAPHVPAKGASSPNVKTSKKFYTEKQESHHLITQKLFLSLSLSKLSLNQNGKAFLKEREN